ncbi:MAG TPA: hypothetical protein VJS69_05020, partial [Candidatus Krumholzibacteria bacterium]|nr:hypothetical protein [Candidatus Krumholzibacteria bacterium]
KIRLGLKVANKQGKEYPKETPWFVCPPEVETVYGKEPTELDVMLPHEDPEVFFPQKLAMYGSGTGLQCHGNGEVARRLNTKGEWVERSCPCDFLKTDANPKGACTEQSSLMVLLPKVSMGGCYQITTGSFHSTRTLNSALDYIRGLAGRLALIPLKLRRVPRETHNDGKKQMHYPLELILDGDLRMIRDLRADIEGSLIPRTYQIEGPIDENKRLDPFDVEEDDGGVEAEDLANMDNAQLADVQKRLREQQDAKKAAPVKPEPAKPAAPASVPHTNGSAPAAVLIPKEDWQVIIYAVDEVPELVEIKKRWKSDNNVSNITLLKAEGQQAFMSYVQAEAAKLGLPVPF